jgi:hypothetical protein
LNISFAVDLLERQHEELRQFMAAIKVNPVAPIAFAN